MGTDQGKTSNIVGLALLAARARRRDSASRHDDVPPSVHAGDARRAGRARSRCGTSSRRAIRRCTTGMSTHGARLRQRGPVEAAAFVSASRRIGGRCRQSRSEERARRASAWSTYRRWARSSCRDATSREFLNRIYINRWDTLAVGRCRYGVMLRDDGMVLDDGTTSRLSATHYLMTTTTVNAVNVMQHLEYLLQVEWPELECIRHVGHRAMGGGRALRSDGARGAWPPWSSIDVSNAAFPFLAVGDCELAAGKARIPARLFRMSYSGELAYEIHVPVTHGRAMWEAVMAAGEPFGIMPYGTEAMSTLAHRKGTRGRRSRGRRAHDRRRPRHGQAREPGQMVHRQAAARAAGADVARPLAAGRPDRDRWR